MVRTRRSPGPPQRQLDPPAAAAPPATATGVPWVLVLLGAALAYPLLESRFWSRTLWGANTLAFLPAAWRLVPLACAVLFLPRIAAPLGAWLERWRPAPRMRATWPWITGLVAAVVFWLVRERHLYWGDALPLSISVPAGQRFHADEPLTMWFQHAVWAVGGGRWTAAQAIAVASAVAGGVWAALQARGFARSLARQ